MSTTSLVSNPLAVASRYKSVAVNTANPVQIVLMLHDGALRFAAEARAAMESGDRARAGERIGRAQAIIQTLAGTLDAEKAPELCENLAGLYAFASRRLLEANLQQNAALLGEFETTITPLRDAWRELVIQGATAASP